MTSCVPAVQRLRRRLLPVLATGALLAACGGDKKNGGITDPGPDVTVASVQVTAPGTAMQVGGTMQLSGSARNAGGAEVSGKSLAWQSSSDAVASVSASGMVTAKAPGAATITATVDGKSASVPVTVTNPEAARVAIAPGFLTVDVGATGTLAASAFSASGVALVSPSVTWTPLGTAVANVTGSGLVGGVAPGDTRVVAQVNAATDTALVAVLGPQSLLGTALPGGAARLDVTAAQTITVPIVLDLSKVSANGDLGAAQLQLSYDPAVLAFSSATVLGGADYNNVSATGTFRLAFAGSAPQGSARVTLATLTFQVVPGTPAGTQRALALSFTARPVNTAVQPYELPIAVAGRIRVVN